MELRFVGLSALFLWLPCAASIVIPLEPSALLSLHDVHVQLSPISVLTHLNINPWNPRIVSNELTVGSGAESTFPNPADFFYKAQISLIQTLLPVDQEDFFAVFLAESVSGVAGGCSTKLVSLVNGNKNPKQRGFLDAGASSGAYFGLTAAIRTTVKTFGASPVLLDLIAFTSAVAAAQIFQFRRQLIIPQRKRAGDGPSMYELMKFNNPTMFEMMKFSADENCQLKPREPITGEVCRVEFGAEFIKWFCYYTLLIIPNPVIRVEDAAILGGAVGAVTQLIREKDDGRLKREIAAFKRARQARIAAGSTVRRYQDILELIPGIRYLQAATEGAAQLAVYEICKQYVISVAPYFEGALPSV